MPALDPESLPRHLDRLYRAAWALCGSPHEAEDLVQETFARVLARPRLLRGQDELAYLMTVLRNTFLTERRTAARRPRVSVTTLDEVEPVDPRGRDRPEEALQAQEIFAAIASLPERYRLALVACDIAGLSQREAAKLLETKEATIATRVFRARRFVVRALEAPGPLREESTPSGDGTTAAAGPSAALAEGGARPQGDAGLEGEVGRKSDASQEQGISQRGREGNVPQRSLTQRGPT
jgi:RNA polymerase sigma-70 factor, ECF subfamily